MLRLILTWQEHLTPSPDRVLNMASDYSVPNHVTVNFTVCSINNMRRIIKQRRLRRVEHVEHLEKTVVLYKHFGWNILRKYFTGKSRDKCGGRRL
jgi:hypothetical protein